jgi:hypothetical protein
VVIKAVATEGEEDQVPPAGVGGRLRLEDNRNEEADVVDTPGLVVELRHKLVGRIVPHDCGVGHAGTCGAGGGGPGVVRQGG